MKFSLVIVILYLASHPNKAHSNEVIHHAVIRKKSAMRTERWRWIAIYLASGSVAAFKVTSEELSFYLILISLV